MLTYLNFFQRFALTFSLAISLFSTAFADTISLNNGRTFSGEIKKETPTHITVDIGGGTISFRKSSIKTIKKSNSDAATPNRHTVNANIELNPPEQLQDIATAYKKLKKTRHSAIRAKKQALVFQNKRADLITRQNNEKNQRASLVKKVNLANPNRDLHNYNHLIYQQNQSTNILIALQKEISQGLENVISGKKIITTYLKALDSLKSEVETRKAKQTDLENTDQSKSFWAKIDRKLAQFDDEFKSLSVPHENASGHMILTALINNKTEGRFLLDTGASYVTLSEAMAKRLNLNTSRSSNFPLTMADGSIIDGKPVILSSMRVGDVHANNIPAMILPSTPGKSIDGLLGMSFLREFVINLDPVNNKLVFKRFSP